MRKIYAFIVALCITALVSCTDQEGAGSRFTEYEVPVSSYDTELYGVFPYIFTMDSLLVAVNMASTNESFGRLYSINDNMSEIAGSTFGKAGRGPGEFIYVDPTPAYGNTFLLRNLNMTEVATMQVMTDAEGRVSVREAARYSFERVMHDDLGWEAHNLTRIDDDHVVGVTYGGKGEFFTLFDNEMRIVGSFGDPLIEEEIPAMERRTRLNGEVARNGGSFCFVPHDRPMIAYYRINEGEMPQEVWRSTFYDSFYTVEENKVKYSDDKTIGITHQVAMGDDYIYILFLDIPISKADASKAETFAANIVFVYDHQGNKIAKLNLDQRIYRLALSKDQTKMYGVNYPENQVVVFDIPEFD